MSINAGLEITGVQQLETAISNVALLGRSMSLMNRIAGVMISQVQQTFDSERDPLTGAPWPKRVSSGISSNQRLLFRTGALRRSLLGRPIVTEDKVVIGSNLKYASIHNNGGVIFASGANRARQSQNPHLSIPLSAEARRLGNASLWWSWKESRGENPFIFTSQSGNVLIATSNKKGNLTLHYVLKKSITIPKRRYLDWGEKYIQQINGVVEYYLSQLMEGNSE
jgi:phage gpG-like protein